MTRNLKISIAGTVFVLVLFWVIIVETLLPHIFLLGLLSIGVIVFVAKEFVLTEDVRFSLHLPNLWRIVKYVGHLVYQIIVANIQVARIVLSKHMIISPTFIRFKSPVKKDATKAILGNSITLTPGTLTVDIDEDEFVVHGLTKKHAEGMLDWFMADELQLMERDEKPGRAREEESPSG